MYPRLNEKKRPKRSYLGLLGGTLAVAMLLLLTPSGVFAAPSLSWTSPPDGTAYNVGTEVQPSGTASGFVTGDGLDLALVLDASGSMGINATSGGVTKTRLQWQADAAIAMVNSLPTVNTSVAVINYAFSASISLNLTPTTSSQDIINAINDITASGATATGPGIDLAQSHLINDGTDGRSKQMVVISDGQSNWGRDPVLAAADAADAGTTVHGVVIPGGSATEMENIANSGGGAFADFSNPDDLENIENFFGAGGGLVGLEQLDITLPDNTLIEDYATDAFGNFTIDPAWAMLYGDNTFTAKATFAEGSILTQELNLIGRDAQEVPEPATWGLLALSLVFAGLYHHRRRKA